MNMPASRAGGSLAARISTLLIVVLLCMLAGALGWSLALVDRDHAPAISVSFWVAGILVLVLLVVGVLRQRAQARRASERSAEVERLYSEVARANTAKSEFLANISHELRTPLNAIVGFVELLRDGVYGNLSPRQVPPVERIAASATHLRHLVDQVLDIAKMAAGRLEVHPEALALRPFVLNVASELESLVNERGLSLSIAVGATLPRIRTDPTHLRQILVNLLGNAVKYTEQGSVTVRARAVPVVPEAGVTAANRSHRDSGEVRLESRMTYARRNWIAVQVIDTGVGIDPADHARIFEEFEQVNAGPRGESMQRGTGLGLPISRRLARLLGGDLSVESQPGKGSTFTLWLPVHPQDMAQPVAPASASREAVSSS
jgi:signal transduction histidine kinase